MFKIKFIFLFMSILPLFGEIIIREGECTLETIQGQQILHLRGSPYEMGYAHGKLLKKKIHENISNFIDKKYEGMDERVQSFQNHLMTLLSYSPPHLIEELRGMAQGAEVPLSKLLVLNLFPEMFHCSGIAAFGNATKEGQLVHARVLDYSIGKNLQETAVLIVAEPDGKIPFVNVSYAGFIGSVTGMNAAQIAMGEIGGDGYGSWEGMPMAFLIREILENADSLESAKKILSQTKRTCEYYYVISDGKAKDAFGVYATADKIQFIRPSTTYTIYSINNPEGQTFEQPEDCLALTRDNRYPPLKERLLQYHGEIDENIMKEIIKQPVAMPSNLHNAIFLPEKLMLLVSHAGPNESPACDEPYTLFSLSDLIAK